jgi:hypothetical protein
LWWTIFFVRRVLWCWDVQKDTCWTAHMHLRDHWSRMHALIFHGHSHAPNLPSLPDAQTTSSLSAIMLRWWKFITWWRQWAMKTMYVRFGTSFLSSLICLLWIYIKISI